jgi:hypothetical protein
MEPNSPSTDLSARRTGTIAIAVTVIVVMAFAYAQVYVQEGRNNILRDNIEWLKVLIDQLAGGGV